MSATGPTGIDLSADQRPKIVAVLITTWILAFLTVSLRFTARILVKAGLWWDDWVVLSSLSPATNLCTNKHADVRHGLGLHLWAAPPGSVSAFLKSLVIAELFYVAATVAIKLSILLSYRRSFRVPHVQKATTFVAWIVFAWALACILIVCFQCIPLQGYWDKSIPAKCGVNNRDYFLGKSIPDTVTDIGILMIPMRAIWELHTTRTQKTILTLTFLMGGLVIVISIIRLVCLMSVDLSSEDITWNFVPYLIWTCVELNIGTVAACLPCLRPVYTYFREKTGLSGSRPSAGSFPNPQGKICSGRTPWRLFSDDDEYRYGDQVPMQAGGGITVHHDYLVQTKSASRSGGDVPSH
ncbi:uncharacterized protein BO72DRAFT_427727 [Aspergillus fijiensis CBS 313.89]|uniref:Rhodopsin domain-containing protein n=1 Tax=Aspergillus fijiensis CBS 313.89 TaxID=1448319 RepID=A0A8G1RSV3_9EURO|nr:uncharacterized protein BO72DRAFT_427727 [Aspergillus fijiensis CBS 313.89]RAK78072.1 hypothetical protein BO72DRAFT_427727 [Aspergillus fijiensis CBS 313.89]